MPYVTKAANSKFRLLISGFPNTGKTTSLPTFIYGPFDYWDKDQQSDAIAYAGDKHMVIVTCPGEMGIRSLPPQTEHITSYFPEAADSDNINSVEWSRHAINDFDNIIVQIMKDKPDILVCDGMHGLWDHIMNRATGGDYLAGVDIGTETSSSRVDPYAVAKLYGQSHGAFGQYITGLYHSSVPLFIGTVWEEWERGKQEVINPQSKTLTIGAMQYLWPAIPGKMARAIVGRFDARLSARLEKNCLHRVCEESKQLQDHFVWQFYPKDYVQGVGIKGLKLTAQMKQKPWIHQRWDYLQELMQ